MKGSEGASAQKELKTLQAEQKAILTIEKRIKDSKAQVKTLNDELELKLELKRVGGEDFKTESQLLLEQIPPRIVELDPKVKSEKTKLTALKKDHAALEARIMKTDTLLTEIGGQLTDEDAQRLILKKLHDLASHELDRYLNAEKRLLIQVVENLWDKYAVSSRELEAQRTETLAKLDGFLKGLGYLG